MVWRIDNYTLNYESVQGKFDVNLYIPPIHPKAISRSDPNCYGYLFITLKVFYEKDDSGSGVTIDTTKYKTAAWPKAEWEEYLRVTKHLSTFWDSKFWLVLSGKSSEYKKVEKYIAIYDSPQKYSGIGPWDVPRTYEAIKVFKRTIVCRFNLEILPNAAGAHKKVKVAYIVDKNTNLPPTSLNTYTNRSNASYYDNGDVITATNGYNTIIHELGHAIGLPHIGEVTDFEACLTRVKGKPIYQDKTEKSNAEKCYQGPFAMDIMGGGGELHYQDAIPWRSAFQEMTGIPFTQYIVHQMAMVDDWDEVIEVDSRRAFEFNHGF
mgnify:CR=1 FL=1